MTQSVHARWAAPAALLLLAGCYTYVPTDLASAPPDQELRVYLSRRALADIPEDIPTGNTFLTGRLVRQTQDSILLQVPVSRRVEGAGALDLRQNVFVPKSEIVDIEYRQLNRVKTTAALAASVAAGAALVLGVFDATADTQPGSGESPDQIRIPSGSFPAP